MPHSNWATGAYSPSLSRAGRLKKRLPQGGTTLKRIAVVGTALNDWKSLVLPLNYIRVLGGRAHPALEKYNIVSGYAKVSSATPKSGVEPPQTESKSVALPLGDSGKFYSINQIP